MTVRGDAFTLFFVLLLLGIMLADQPARADEGCEVYANGEPTLQELRLLATVNDYRARRGRPPLAWSPILQHGARRHLCHYALEFDAGAQPHHDSVTGGPGNRGAQSEVASYHGRSVFEAVELWRESAPHHAAILGDFECAGPAVAFGRYCTTDSIPFPCVGPIAAVLALGRCP